MPAAATTSAATTPRNQNTNRRTVIPPSRFRGCPDRAADRERDNEARTPQGARPCPIYGGQAATDGAGATADGRWRRPWAWARGCIYHRATETQRREPDCGAGPRSGPAVEREEIAGTNGTGSHKPFVSAISPRSPP